MALTRILFFGLFVAFFSIPAHPLSQSSMSDPVDARWIWPAAYSAQSSFKGKAYLLQLHIPRSGKPEPRGPGPWAWPLEELHIVIRLERRPDIEVIFREYRRLKDAWNRHDVKVAGLQLDYDSPTAKFRFYAEDLRELRSRLEKDDSLSITGLADWAQLDDLAKLLKTDAASGDRFGRTPQGISVFFQLYRERRPHEDTDAYVSRLEKLQTSFKVGLLPRQQLSVDERVRLKKNRHFHGYVTFHGRGAE